MHLIHRCQQGFTTVTLMGVLLVGGIAVAASFAAVDPDIGLSRADQDQKQAYGAAEAGLQWYLSRLSQDNSFYVHCTSVDEPAPGEAAPVNQRWNGTGKDPRVWRRLPGEQALYTVELMPTTNYSQCVPGNQYSMIDASGNMRLRISGKARGKVRTILATLRRQNFLDYIYFTDFETQPPPAYPTSAGVQTATQQCQVYREDRTSNCQEISFISGDWVKGPLHTNDSALLCGKPTFGRNSRDSIEIVGTPKYAKSSCSGSSPELKGTQIDEPPALGMPPSNSELMNIADVNYQWAGKTTIELNGTQMTVWNTAKYGTDSKTMALPPNGVIYVANQGCTSGFVRQQTYQKTSTGCGDVWLKGNYKADLTIAAANDIVVNGTLKRGTASEGALLGLVANNFVRVYHPVDFTSNGCTNRGDALTNVLIEAAILALNHSFLTDNWDCGAPLGSLWVYGAIAQRFRGPVGTNSGGTVASGYLKQYEYNDRLRYREPPYFLDPVQASWRISRATEQLRAVMQR